MTMNKRFKNVEEKLDWGTVQYFTYYDEKITDKEIEKLVNHLLNQNDELNKSYGAIIEENIQLKAFIKRLTNNCGEIILMNGMGYKVDKILGDYE